MAPSRAVRHQLHSAMADLFAIARALDP